MAVKFKTISRKLTSLCLMGWAVKALGQWMNYAG